MCVFESVQTPLAFYRLHGKNLSNVAKKKEIAREFKVIFSTKPTINSFSHPGDPSGKTKVENTEFVLEKGSVILSCIDWSKKMEQEFFDHLKVWITTTEFQDFIRNEAY